MLASRPVERIKAVSKEEFYRSYIPLHHPFVITGLVDSWPALQIWSMEYIAENFATEEVGVVPLKNGQLDLNTERGSRIERLTVAESMLSITEGKLKDGWAIGSALEDFPSEMQQQSPAPVYCSNGKFLRARVFLGPSGLVTSLHQDLFDNLYTTVKGCKRVTLFAPRASVYRHPPFSKLPNHAQADPEKPDYDRFPKFQQAQPYIVDLMAGETLYIPALWWHHLRNMQPTIAVSFWWSRGWMLPIVWVAAMYKKMRTI
jgi:lysine-specific demethylase 8